MIWATGNLLTVPIVKRIGLAMGLLIWDGTSLVTGWLSGVVGFMGIKKQTDDITSWPLNYTGLFLGLLSMGVAAFVQPEVNSPSDTADGPDVPARKGSNIQTPLTGVIDDSSASFLPLLNGTEIEEVTKTDTKDRVAGVLMSLAAGFCYGINFDPPQYVIDNFTGVSQNSYDYAFSHFCGILMMSTFWFAVYCGAKTFSGQNIEVYPRVILPGFLSGIMWGIAQTAFFVANGKLDFVVSFPLISLGPGFIGFLWGVFLFKEIKGLRNYLLVLGVFVTAMSCAVCIVFSRL